MITTKLVSFGSKVEELPRMAAKCLSALLLLCGHSEVNKNLSFLLPPEIHFVTTIRCWKLHLSIMIAKCDFKTWKEYWKEGPIILKAVISKSLGSTNLRETLDDLGTLIIQISDRCIIYLSGPAAIRFHSFTHPQQHASSLGAPSSGRNHKAKVSFQLWEWPWTQVQPNHRLAPCLGFPTRPDLSEQMWTPQTQHMELQSPQLLL